MHGDTGWDSVTKVTSVKCETDILENALSEIKEDVFQSDSDQSANTNDKKTEGKIFTCSEAKCAAVIFESKLLRYETKFT